MSNSQFAFIAKSLVPGREALQACIDKLGFDLKLHPDFAPHDNSGFLPFTLNGEDGPGFEIHYGDTTEILDAENELLEIVGDRDCSIQMVWRSSMKDLACVMVVSCALAKDFDAVVSYEAEEQQTADELLAGARAVLRDVAAGAA